MARPKADKVYLIKQYEQIALELKAQGYNNEEIGVILNRSRSVISRLLGKEN